MSKNLRHESKLQQLAQNNPLFSEERYETGSGGRLSLGLCSCRVVGWLGQRVAVGTACWGHMLQLISPQWSNARASQGIVSCTERLLQLQELAVFKWIWPDWSPKASKWQTPPFFPDFVWPWQQHCKLPPQYCHAKPQSRASSRVKSLWGSVCKAGLCNGHLYHTCPKGLSFWRALPSTSQKFKAN